MKLFLANQIRAADAFTIENEPISSIDLMERAARGLADWIIKNYSNQRRFMIFAGPGNNGGDAWALARILWKKDFRNLQVYLVKISDTLSPDSRINKKRLLNETEVPVSEIRGRGDFPDIGKQDILVDAMFGSGLSRRVEGLAGEVIKYLNKQEENEVIAIDLPSGLFSESSTQSGEDHIIKANITLTFQFPKLSFFFAENEPFVGAWHVIPIGIHKDFIKAEPTSFHMSMKEDIAELLEPRKKFSHKGTYGHGLLIAGSYGMMGAAVLAAKAAIHSGAGLITSHIPRMGVDIMQISVPEILISIDESDIIFTEHPSLNHYSALAIGPGLNQKSNTKKALLNLLSSIKKPCIIDADGINLLASVENWRDLIPENCILTPHPKEFERLFGSYDNSYSRLTAQIEFSKSKRCVVVLKGANTCITLPDGNVWFNTTGNPGMATGGSGDVLTGMILGFLTQGYTTTDASLLGVFLHGLAGDLALKYSSIYSLSASSIIDSLGDAFRSLIAK